MILNSMTERDRFYAASQSVPARVQSCDNWLVLIDTHRSNRRHQRVRLRTVGRGQQKNSSAGVTDTSQVHNLPLAGNGCQREPIRNRFSERR